MSRTPLHLLAAAALGAAVLAPVAAQAATPYQATVKTSTTRTNVGSVVTVSGKVTGGPVKGKKVSIYVSNGGSFTLAKTAALTSTGTYSSPIRMSDGGTTLFRVVKGADSGHAAVKVTSGPVKVFRWAGGYEFASRKIDGTDVNGVKSRGGWEVWTNHPVIFNVADHECIAWDAQAGVLTSSTESQVEGGFAYPNFYTTFTLSKGQDPVGLYGAVAPGTDFGVYANTTEASSLELVDIGFKCNTPH